VQLDISASGYRLDQPPQPHFVSFELSDQGLEPFVHVFPGSRSARGEFPLGNG